MSNSIEQTLGNQEHPPSSNPNSTTTKNHQTQVQHHHDQPQEWETMARAWLSAFPEGKAVNVNQVEAWIDSNYSSLPADLLSMPRSDLIDRLLSIQNYMKLPVQVVFLLLLISFFHSNFDSHLFVILY